jgi:hypothetical protein
MTQTKSNLLLNSEKLHNSLILIQKASSLFGGPYVFPICYHSNMCLRKHSDIYWMNNNNISLLFAAETNLSYTNFYKLKFNFSERFLRFKKTVISL